MHLDLLREARGVSARPVGSDPGRARASKRLWIAFAARRGLFPAMRFVNSFFKPGRERGMD
jgi:hypothetical protein